VAQRTARWVFAAPAWGSVALTLGGCPGGAVLEDPDRFPQYPGGTSGAPSASGAGGAGGETAGAGGSVGGAGAGAGGSAGAGSGGSGGGVVFSCDVAVAMKNSCSRSGCHNATLHAANLDLSDLAANAALLVDRPALHPEIGCNTPGTPYRECTPEELTARGCPTAMLIDSANFENSWVVKKLKGEQMMCGGDMPEIPGDSAGVGWSDARRTCLLEYFQSLIPPK
jgi:hypothetical protein